MSTQAGSMGLHPIRATSTTPATVGNMSWCIGTTTENMKDTNITNTTSITKPPVRRNTWGTRKIN